jgi:tetratricopeptide (TPR) repeat protein
MSEIRLQEYTAQIKALIQDDLHDEAIAHCQHILRYYPRHIETYCLLGEACLEKGMYREAIEFFQRTLSADPENFVARVGLGIIYDEQGALAEAIWQMERAFELAPGNAEVRRELQRLYTQRDGVEKTRLKLTRAALGHLYARNGLYERAISEFRAVLRQDPELPSIRVALIEALWREGRRLEAVETCLDLLEALPNCLKANLILGEIWMRGGNEDDGEARLNIARSLDPENLVAQEMMGRDSPLPYEEVLIPELSVTLDMLGAVAVAGAGFGEEAPWEVEPEAPGIGVEEVLPPTMAGLAARHGTRGRSRGGSGRATGPGWCSGGGPGSRLAPRVDRRARDPGSGGVRR